MDREPLSDNSRYEDLPILPPVEIGGYNSERKSKGLPPGPVLMEVHKLIELLEAVGGFTLTRRAFLSYSSPKINLIEPPITKDGKACCVYPDHFERMATILTLRQGYHLPLKTIRQLLDHFPQKANHLILEKKLTIAELLDLAKMLPRGFKVDDLVMAKTCDLMTQDTVSPYQAVSAASEPGDALQKLEEQAILARLDEIRAWVNSGRRQEFVRRESAEDFKNLAQNHLIGRKISKKILARRTRLLRERGGE